jgi:hypothetical protein
MLMKYVKVERREEPRGFYLNAVEYHSKLPQFESILPSGAWAFASNPDHYDFSGPRCIKDLQVESVAVSDNDNGFGIEILFRSNPFKHDARLTIKYVSVTDFRVEALVSKGQSSPLGVLMLGDVQLDEILPCSDGCSQEIKMTGGSIFITCADLEATWS